MIDPIATTIALVALVVSGYQAWWTLLRRGEVRMTLPTFVSFSYDVTKRTQPSIEPKIFFRTLFYGAGRRGLALDNVFLSLTLDGVCHEFSVWGYGDDKLVRGSGLFVGETGVVSNHHFTLPESPDFRFTQGEYILEVFASTVGKRLRRICVATLTVSGEDGPAFVKEAPDVAYWFQREPHSSRYRGSLERP